MNFLRKIEEPHYYDFVRFGEDDYDTEQENSGDHYFYITRDVSLND